MDDDPDFHRLDSKLTDNINDEMLHSILSGRSGAYKPDTQSVFDDSDLPEPVSILFHDHLADIAEQQLQQGHQNPLHDDEISAQLSEMLTGAAFQAINQSLEAILNCVPEKNGD